MLINEYLSPVEAWIVTATVLGATFLVLTASGVFVGWAARALPEGADRRGILIVPTLLVLWATVAITMSAMGPLKFEWFLPFALFPILAGAALSFTGPVASLLRQTPTQWMIGLQTYRAAGAIFLFPMYTSGALTAGFAYPAAIGDVITGLAAPYVAWRLARDPVGARGIFLAWTLFGIADLIVAPLSAQLWGFAAEGREMTFAITAIPLFLGPPFGILIHILTWRSYSLRHPAPGPQATQPAQGRSAAPSL
ncbi:MAG: hypothetical protein AAFY66_01545 [Pseudomonadota bacterium]